METKILIVDDDADMRRVVRGILEPFGEVLEASNGKDGLRLVATEKLDMMLLDVTMPDLGGLAVLKAARFLDPSLRILMLTGESGLETAKRALDDGARAYITKPFDPETLRGEVRRLVAGVEEDSAVYGGRPWSVRK